MAEVRANEEAARGRKLLDILEDNMMCVCIEDETSCRWMTEATRGWTEEEEGDVVY